MIYRSKTLMVVCVLLAGVYMVASCKKDAEVQDNTKPGTTPFAIQKPIGFPNVIIDPDNLMTVEGVALGRYLFYDSILSQDFAVSCASCHKQEFAFSDKGHNFSKGVHGQFGNRNSMALFNKAWDKGPFFWNGRAKTLEIQAGMPVVNPKEMNLDWNSAISRLQASKMYQRMFIKAFGPNSINIDNATKAIAQFVKSIVSCNSKYDKFLTTHDSGVFTPLELRGYKLFFTDPDFIDNTRNRIEGSGLDCFHCHSIPLMTPENGTLSRNRGIMGNGIGDSATKTPSLRNLSYTGPYMFDGSIPTLDSVIGHYNNTTYFTLNMDQDMFEKKYFVGQTLPEMRITSNDRAALNAFLLTLDDPVFITNPAYSSPFK